MHEMSLAQDCIRVIREHLPPKMILSAVRISVGRLMHVDEEAFRFALGVLARETFDIEPEIALSFEETLIECVVCRNRYRAEDYFFECPACGSLNGTILQGRDLRVESIQAEEEDENDR